MIGLEELVRAARLSSSVGPFTLRRLFFRARVFTVGDYTSADVRALLPLLQQELQEILPLREVPLAMDALGALVTREDGSDRTAAPL